MHDQGQELELVLLDVGAMVVGDSERFMIVEDDGRVNGDSLSCKALQGS